MLLGEGRGEGESPVPLNRDSAIFTSWRDKTGIPKRSEVGLLKTKSTNTGRRAET